MDMFRSLLTNPARTRADRLLRNRLVAAFVVGSLALYGGLFLAGLLPKVLEVPALVGLAAIWAVANVAVSWRRADWENRATRSKDEAGRREQRRRALGADD
ncbi:MAG: hypothetical protein Q7T61_19595 [Caulobacter sp.]|nr:hypothetical protein [Caulobacter sp.]